MNTSDRQTAFSGTKEVAERLRFDVERLESYLGEHVKGFAGPIRLSQFKGGQSNPTYLVETPQRRYVLRRKPPGKLLPSAHAVDREFRVISALYRQSFPVAEPILYCADESVIGTAFFVMSHVEGRVFWEPDMPSSNPAERAQVYDAMNATIARLHSFDPAAIGLSDYGRGENYVARQIERWSKQYRASETGKVDEMERLMAWLPTHLPPPQPPRLVHGDYRLDNMILAPDASQGSSRPRLGVVDAGRPAGGFLLSPDAMAYAAGESRHRLTGRLRSRRTRHSIVVRVCRYLREAHRARSATLSAGLFRLQFLPPRCDLARHRWPGSRRHRDRRVCGRQNRSRWTAGRQRLGIRTPGRRLGPQRG